MVCKSRYEIGDPAAASSTSEEKEASTESVFSGIKFGDRF
jgi:hypothetical protein